MSSIDGFVEFDVSAAGKPCKTWYTVYGDLKSSKYPPLVVLHGGPGMPHNYLKAYGQLASKASIPVILYDSIGCGNSTLLPEKQGDGSFFNTDLHLDELENLVRSLGIQERFSLLGHSYGGMAAALYAATRQPNGLQHLIIHSSPASIELWDEAQMNLRRQLPQDLQHILDKHEADNTTESDEYQAVITEFRRRHVYRAAEPHPDFQATLDAANKDPTVVRTMYGDDEFHTCGTLKGWSMIDQIHNISVPTLLMNGRYDTAQDNVMKPFFELTPKVRWIQFAESSHLAHLETEQERLIDTVREFLTDIYW